MNASNPHASTPAWVSRTVASTAREVQSQRYRVEVVSGPDSGKAATAEGDELSVGTAPSNHLVLSDPSASRHHLTIATTADGFQLRDLGSTGTLLAGYRVEVAYIDSGATIQVGDTTLRFETLDDSLARPLSERESFGEVLGKSVAMRRLFAVLERAAAGEDAILIDGEPGTGKSALAEAIHRHSARASGPFVVVDCGAIAPSSIDSELFGHEAFGGADEQRPGAFAAAHGGTLFLDEVGELGPELQAKLVRALESRQVRRVGSVEPVAIDVRVIAASRRDLRPEVNAGAFHAELYHRLSGVRATVPPLRDRRDDIPLLAELFARQISGNGSSAATPELVASLARQPWPGNVRELRAAVERAALDQSADDAARSESWPELDFTISFRESKEGALAVWTRVYVRELVDRYGGNLSRAARAVSMDRNHLRDLLHKYAMNSSSNQQ